MSYSVRWSRIKEQFTRQYKKAGGQEGVRSASRRLRGERGFWQRRFWEHTIRDETDLERHLDYIHYNPVKHGLVSRPKDWPYSSFHRWVREGAYPHDWGCGPSAPSFDDLEQTAME
jgi:putative transposase